MKNYSLFFIGNLLINAWVFVIISSGLVLGQEEATAFPSRRDSLIVQEIAAVSPNPADSSLIHQRLTGSGIDTLASAITIKDPKELKRDSLAAIYGYLPIDSLKARIYAYQVLDENSYSRQQVRMDSMLYRFEINNPVMKKYYAGSFLGNNGLSYYPITFSHRSRPSDYLFTDHISLYMHRPEEMIYYQTKFPYSVVSYSSAGARVYNESVFNLLHTQNINEKWNVGLLLDVISSVGQYTNQNSSDNAFSFFSSYKGKQYTISGSFNFNNIRMKENGGLFDPFSFTENITTPDAIRVRSTVGKTILQDRSLYFVQSYAFKKLSLLSKKEPGDTTAQVSRFTLVHTFKYRRDKREYTDTATYYANPTPYLVGLPDKNTSDSLYFRRMFNHFELMVRERERKRFTAGFSVGLLSELDRYNMDMIADTTIINYTYRSSSDRWGTSEMPVINRTDIIINHRSTHKYANTAITGRFFNHSGKYLNWNFNGRLYFTGYKLGDLNINGSVQLNYYTSRGRNSLIVGGSIDNAVPGYFLNKYTSNWLMWDNDFSKSQEIRLKGEFVSPHNKLRIGAFVSQLNNYVFINTLARPEQTSQPLITGTAFVDKDLRWWKLCFLFRLYGQYSSHPDIIPLPSYAAYQSTYFETWLVRNVLEMQLGWDFNIHSSYYAYGYMPSSGMFHLQTEQQIGNYSFFDVFLNLKLKQARIFIKTEGLNTLVKSLGKDYFMVYRYPLNVFRIKFGVSWAFYD